MEIILLERIEKLGQMGDVVNVKAGYARNFLLPQKKALRATDENRSQFEQQRGKLEANNLESKNEAEIVGKKIDGQSFIIIRQAGDSGQLYGSVTTRDIAGEVAQGGITITRNQVTMEAPIKILGLHNVRLMLHPEVFSNISVNVARTQEEADRQARGEDVTVEQLEMDEEDALSAEEVFEDKEQVEQAEQELESDVEAEVEQTLAKEETAKKSAEMAAEQQALVEAQEQAVEEQADEQENADTETADEDADEGDEKSDS